MRLLHGLILMLLASGSYAYEPKWNSLKQDGLHDPEGAGINLLQEPAEALSVLPPDTAGNQVNWIKALSDGVINPRTNLWPETKVRLRNTDILFKETGEMPVVRFPHRQHTQWLDCSNCHEKVFVSKAGANPVDMFKSCHGAVAFPLTECDRCHTAVVCRHRYSG